MIPLTTCRRFVLSDCTGDPEPNGVALLSSVLNDMLFRVFRQYHVDAHVNVMPKRTRSGFTKAAPRRRYSRRSKYSKRRISRVHASSDVVVSGREFVGDISASGDLSGLRLPLNPGLSTLFPRLSHMAQLFTEYDCMRLSFTFKSNSSDAVLATAASSALGSVIGVTQYNPLEPAFQTKSQMLQYMGAKAAKPSVSQRWKVYVKNRGSVFDRRFIRGAGVPPNANPQTYDIGIFNLGVQGCQVPPPGTLPGVIGELWVSYKFRFSKPSLNNITVMTENWTFSNFSLTGSPYGQTQTLNPDHAGIGITFGDTSSHNFFFPADIPPNKRFLVVIAYFNSTATTWNVGAVECDGGLIHPIREPNAPNLPSVPNQTPVVTAPNDPTLSDGSFIMSFIVECIPTYQFPQTTVHVNTFTIGASASTVSATMWVTEVNDND